MRESILAFVSATVMFAAASVPAVQPPAPPAPGDPGRGELIAGPSAPVARFAPTKWEPMRAEATFALTGPMDRAGDLPSNYRLRPLFSTTAEGRSRVVIPVESGTSLYGTGEVAGPLLRNGRTVTLWNTDAYAYTPASPSLYQSHPWVLGVRSDGTAFGVLADTTWKTDISLDGAITITSDGPAFPVYVIDRAGPKEVLTALKELTGPMPLPPLWAVGYHQCRYSYFPEAQVREIAGKFRELKMPASVIWFDIDYMDGYRVFTFDKQRFPDVAKLNAVLGAMGWKRIWMIDPGIKAEEGYWVHDELVSKNLEVKTASGQTFKGPVWPGMCVFPDYTMPEAREWWAGLYKDFMAVGIDGVWNDMNEPAVFDTPTKTMPVDNQHRGGMYQSGPGAPEQMVTPGPHARFHNVYGLLMAQATFEGIARVNPTKRPFVLTRAGYLGSHRYAATWTGDNSATWLDLEQSVPMALSLGLSGQPFAGPDIGGFNGNGPNTTATSRGEHFARWFGVGTLMPFARGHTAKGNIQKEPWSFGEEFAASNRRALERRARLVPYLYTLFREASVTGVPVMRPVFFADPKDPALRGEDDCFLLGDDLLVVPSLMPDRSRVCVLPPGTWRSVSIVDGDRADTNLPDLRVRAGAIVPLGPIEQFPGEVEASKAPLTLLVSLDDQGKARGRLYTDAGDGFDYQRGDYLLTTYEAVREGGSVKVRIAQSEGQRVRAEREVVVMVVTDAGVFVAKGQDGQEIVVPAN